MIGNINKTAEFFSLVLYKARYRTLYKKIHRKKTWLKSTLRDVKKQHCLFCQQDACKVVCSSCFTTLERFEDDARHGPFIDKRPDFIRSIPGLAEHPFLTVGPHQTLLMDLINQFKYGKQLYLADYLANLLSEKIDKGYHNKALPQLVIPVPMHPAKRMFRGFNQTELIGDKLALTKQLNTELSVIRKIKYQTPQAGKSGKARRSRSINPFAVANAEALKSFTHIAILDDVVTTGTTISLLIDIIRQVNPDVKIDIWSLSVSLFH